MTHVDRGEVTHTMRTYTYNTMYWAIHCVELELERWRDQMDPSEPDDLMYENDLEKALAELTEAKKGA